ncbi:hypothetical protein H2248_000248 [Termitomyces sp. 'cryptogamus']|nr:hypothetical protein H2248_000248 [Termitomyces sp. 'cryptogamus']
MPSTQSHIKFKVAFQNGLNSGQEAPWYGVYNWILSQVIFLDLCDDPLNQLTTITYPQSPLTKDIDTDMPEEYDDDNDDDDDDDDENDNNDDDDITMDLMNAADLAHGDTNCDTPSTPPGLVRAMAPSPESDNPNFHFSNFHPPSSPLVCYQKARIVGPDARATMAPSPPEISTLLLIVEIKKEQPLPPDFLAFRPAIKQTKRQAMHAFLSTDFLHVGTIGVIVALGQDWKYFEYTRQMILHHLDLRSSSQQSYGSMSPSPDRMGRERWLKYNKFEEKSELGVFHCTLGTKNSDEAFLVVRQRMIQLAHGLASPMQSQLDLNQ